VWVVSWLVLSCLVLLVCVCRSSAPVDAGQQYCLCFVVLVLLLLLLLFSHRAVPHCAIAKVARSIQQDTQCVSSRLHLASKQANATPAPCMRPLSPCVHASRARCPPHWNVWCALSHRASCFWTVLSPGAFLLCVLAGLSRSFPGPQGFCCLVLCILVFYSGPRCTFHVCVCPLMQFCLVSG
jgi:hypothetical protein